MLEINAQQKLVGKLFHILHGVVHSFRKFIIKDFFLQTVQLLQMFMDLTLISIDPTAE